MTLDKVCECIKANGAAIANQANMAPIDPVDRNLNVSPALLLKLCEALAKKISRAAAEGGGRFRYHGTQSLLHMDLTVPRDWRSAVPVAEARDGLSALTTALCSGQARAIIGRQGRVGLRSLSRRGPGSSAGLVGLIC